MGQINAKVAAITNIQSTTPNNSISNSTVVNVTANTS